MKNTNQEKQNQPSRSIKDPITKRFTAGIMLVVLAGFWLVLAPCLLGVQGIPETWKPLFMSKVYADAAPRKSQRIEAATSANFSPADGKFSSMPATSNLTVQASR